MGINENEFSKMAKHLLSLRQEHGFTQGQVCKIINCSEPAYRAWEHGERAPDTDLGIALAKLYGVSIDYILGLSDYTSIGNKEIHQITGLSNEAIEHLRHYADDPKTDKRYFTVISEMLSNSSFYNSIAYLLRAGKMYSIIKKEKKTDADAYNMMQDIFEAISDRVAMSKDIGQGVRLSQKQSINFYLQCAVDYYKKICDYIVKGDNEYGKR